MESYILSKKINHESLLVKTTSARPMTSSGKDITGSEPDLGGRQEGWITLRPTAVANRRINSPVKLTISASWRRK